MKKLIYSFFCYFNFHDRKIFKKYRNYFLKSEARVKLLDEKFKKQINKGYISKNSLNDYNEYFSNYVSELGSQNSSMIEKVVDSPNQPQKNQFRVDSSLPEFIKKKKTPTRLYPTTEKTNQSTSNLNPSRGISANPSFDSGKMELNGAINTHQQRPADLIDQTGKHKSSRCSDDITSYVGIGDYSEDKKQVLIKHPHPTFDISNPGSCYKIYTPNDNLGSVGYQKAEAKSRNSDGEVEDLKQSSTESDVPRFAKANNEGLPIVKIALSIRDKQKGQQSGAQEAPKAVDGDRIRELASRKVKEIMETVRRERSNSTMLEQSRTVDESDIGSQKGRSVYQNGVGGGLHKNELSTRRKLFMNSNPHSSIFKHQQSPASIEESTQKKKYDAKNASSQQVTHESILNAKNSFFSKNSLSGQRGAIEARFGTAEGRFTEVEAYKEDNKENTKYCQNRLISSKEGSARAKSNTAESNFESKHLLRSPHTPLTSTNLTLVRNLDVKEITPIVSPVNISRKQSLTGDIMTHNFNTLDTYSCATESKKETPYESTARLKVLKGTGGGLSGIKIPHNTAEISKHMDMDSEHSFKNRSGNSINIPEPNTLGVSSTTNCPLEISKNSFSLERSTKFSHNHNNNSNQKYQNGMINGRQHGLGGPNMPSQGPGKAGFHQINTAKTSYMDPNKFYLSGEFLTPLKEMDNSKPSSMKKSNMIKNRDFTKKNFEDRANCNIAVLGNLNSSRMPLESPVINQGSPKKFHSIVMEEDEDLNYKTDDTKEFDFNTRFESEDWQETTRNHSNNPHQGHQPQIDLNHFKRKYGNYSSSGLSNSGYESGLSASINEQNMRSISFASNNHFEKKVMKEVLEGSLLKDPTRIAATSGHFLGETQMINFMREMYANFNHFLNFELKIAISHYVDRLSFKNKLISFFKTKEILNSDLQRGRILWRDTAEYWLDRFRANLLIDKVAPFGCRGKNSGNFSWMTRVEKSKYRTYFDMLNNRTRKVIISIKNLPMNVRKIRANFMRNSQIRQRLRRKEMPHELRPCLFFLNGQARHIHYYDLFLRKHSNVFSPSFEFQDSCIEDFKVDGIFGYVNSGKTVIVIRLDDFNVFDEFSVGERILSVFPLPGEEIAVVPKEGKEILIYRLRDPQRVARIVPISQGESKFLKFEKKIEFLKFDFFEFF